MNRGWIGVDLDGTLAHYDEWKDGAIGEAVLPMLLRVKKWVGEGREVRIFTARISDPRYVDKLLADWTIWCRRYGLPILKLTNVKDFHMIELWDDRAIQIVKNTGIRADGQP
jgi:hypothetical protein